MLSLPVPSPEALAHSTRLAELIRGEIDAGGGWLGFDRYMELALYAPGMGYYSAGLNKFGEGGDFVTAPEISRLFGKSLACQVARVLADTGGNVLELGAGSGKLAVDLMGELDRLGWLPEKYLILEVSADLRERQKSFIYSAVDLRLAQKFEWIEVLPDSLTGVVIGNEVLDALPVHLVRWDENGISERGLVTREGAFVWDDRLLTGGALYEVAERLSLPDGHVSELGLPAVALAASLAAMLRRGVVLLADYGFPRREFYHPQRVNGTLMCHYRHHAHDDPLLYPGLQDITAHVDFTSVAEAAVANGAALLGYASQAQFLINCGITDYLAEVPPTDTARYLPLAAEAQKLLSPAEMGELFKVIAFGKGVESLVGFARGDKQHQL